LFKRLKNGEIKEIDLRLVGFPGTVEFNHPQDLKIIGSEKVFQASDRSTSKLSYVLRDKNKSV
jgi:hypothetical protein